MSNPFDDLKADDETESEAESGTASELEIEPESEPETDAESAAGTDSEHTDDESSTSSTAASSTTTESTSEPADDRDTVDEPTDESDAEPSDESVSPAESGPAFEYSEVKQKPFYARTETVNEFENNIRTTIVPKLAEAEVLDEETREIHDAVLRLANERPERVAELVLEERRQSGSQ